MTASSVLCSPKWDDCRSVQPSKNLPQHLQHCDLCCRSTFTQMLTSWTESLTKAQFCLLTILPNTMSYTKLLSQSRGPADIHSFIFLASYKISLSSSIIGVLNSTEACISALEYSAMLLTGLQSLRADPTCYLLITSMDLSV